MNTLPTVHMNGTSAKMLREGWEKLYVSLYAVQDAAKAMEFNARDYYPQGNHAWEAARDELSEMLQSVDAVRVKVEAVLMAINEQDRK